LVAAVATDPLHGSRAALFWPGRPRTAQVFHLIHGGYSRVKVSYIPFKSTKPACHGIRLICETKHLLYAMKSKENRMRFKRQVFEKAIKKALSMAGVDPETIDMHLFDLRAHETAMDVLKEVAHDRNHPYHMAANRALKIIMKNEEYGAVCPELYEKLVEEHEKEGDRITPLEEALADLDFRLTKRIEEVEKMINTLNGQGPQTVTMPHDLGPLKTELETLKTYVDGLRATHQMIIDRMAEVERAARENSEFVSRIWTHAVNGAGAPHTFQVGNTARAPTRQTTAQRGPRKGGGAIRLILGGAIAVIFNVIAMPLLAYSNGWTDAQTFIYSMLTTMALIGLMILEGLWVNTVFSGPRKSARGFIAGYVYSQGVNPYKQR
jgi:hypothetical protein